MFYGQLCTRDTVRNQEKTEIRKPVETTNINEHSPSSQRETSNLTSGYLQSG